MKIDPPSPVLVIIEGGLVQAVLSQDPANASSVVVVDYDADYNATVTDPNGWTARAQVAVYRPEKSEVQLSFDRPRDANLGDVA